MINHDFRAGSRTFYCNKAPPHVPLGRHPEPEVQSGYCPAASGALG